MKDMDFDKAALDAQLAAIDTQINLLNDQKITMLFKSLGLLDREDVPKNFLEWETILVVVPNRTVSQQLRQYRHSIARIVFATNPNAREIHLFDLKEWKDAFRNKTQLQIRNALKTRFGGLGKLPRD